MHMSYENLSYGYQTKSLWVLKGASWKLTKSKENHRRPVWSSIVRVIHTQSKTIIAQINLPYTFARCLFRRRKRISRRFCFEPIGSSSRTGCNRWRPLSSQETALKNDGARDVNRQTTHASFLSFYPAWKPMKWSGAFCPRGT